MSHFTYVNTGYISNIMNLGDCMDHMAINIQSRVNPAQLNSVKIHRDDKFVLLNSSYAPNPNALPLFLK